MNRFFIGDKVYIASDLYVEDYECLMEDCEELGIEVNDIYGIITATDLDYDDGPDKDPKYSVTWINGKTRTEIITCLDNAWYSSEELTTNNTKFLQGYYNAKEDLEEWCD